MLPSSILAQDVPLAGAGSSNIQSRVEAVAGGENTCLAQERDTRVGEVTHRDTLCTDHNKADTTTIEATTKTIKTGSTTTDAHTRQQGTILWQAP